MRFLNAALALLPVLAMAEDPDKSKIYISAVGHSGNGCPQGSVATSISVDKTVVTVGFDRFQTYIGPGASYLDRTKNCQLHLTLQYPSGFSFAVIDSVYHGFALLEEGVTGTFYSTYFFSSDASKTSTTQTDIKGGGVWANGQVYTKQDLIPATEIVRSPCGGSSNILNINSRINLNSSDPKKFGMITNDDGTVSLEQQVRIEWYQC